MHRIRGYRHLLPAPLRGREEAAAAAGRWGWSTARMEKTSSVGRHDRGGGCSTPLPVRPSPRGRYPHRRTATVKLLEDPVFPRARYPGLSPLTARPLEGAGGGRGSGRVVGVVYEYRSTRDTGDRRGGSRIRLPPPRRAQPPGGDSPSIRCHGWDEQIRGLLRSPTPKSSSCSPCTVSGANRPALPTRLPPKTIPQISFPPPLRFLPKVHEGGVPRSIHAPPRHNLLKERVSPPDNGLCKPLRLLLFPHPRSGRLHHAAR